MSFLTVPHCLLPLDAQVAATVSSPILYQHILNYTEKKKERVGTSESRELTILASTLLIETQLPGAILSTTFMFIIVSEDFEEREIAEEIPTTQIQVADHKISRMVPANILLMQRVVGKNSLWEKTVLSFNHGSIPG